MIQAPVGLAAFDLDGTLIRDGTVCQAIARGMGHLERMNELELLTELGDIAAARAELAGYYAAASRDELLSYLEGCVLAPGAEEGFALLRRCGVRTAIVSITWGFAAERFADRLGADYWVGTGLPEDGRIEHFWPADKAIWLRDLMGRLGLGPERVAAVGDSWGDAEMLRAVGYPFWRCQLELLGASSRSCLRRRAEDELALGSSTPPLPSLLPHPRPEIDADVRRGTPLPSYDAAEDRSVHEWGQRQTGSVGHAGLT